MAPHPSAWHAIETFFPKSLLTNIPRKPLKSKALSRANADHLSLARNFHVTFPQPLGIHVRKADSALRKANQRNARGKNRRTQK
jgi:hypothetical protein